MTSRFNACVTWPAAPFVLLFVFGMWYSGCSSSPQSPAAPPAPPDYVAAPISLSWEVISNLSNPSGFESLLTLTYTGTDTLSQTGWALYFNCIRLIDVQSVPDAVTLTHINGDFYQLTPGATFPLLAKGDQVEIPFTAAAWAIKKSDAPSGFYMEFEDEDDPALRIAPVENYVVKPFTTLEQTSRTEADRIPVPTPASVYNDNERVSLLGANRMDPVIPAPAIVHRDSTEIPVNTLTAIHFEKGLEQEATFLQQYIETATGHNLETKQSDRKGASYISLQHNAVTLPQTIEGQREEAYTLSIAPEQGISITAPEARGIFYGVQSLRALIESQRVGENTSDITIPSMAIIDAPRFGYRGMHLDVSRNFQTKESVLKVLDLMAMYKLNTFHFHLTDDEGWRLEIPSLPELTEVGSRRGHTLDESDRLYPSLGSGPFVDTYPGSGFYSREDYIEILAFAAARHIEVIPEIDLPGHARAAIKAMEARTHRLLALERTDEAYAYQLRHPEDASVYQSVQMWNDNVVDPCLPSTYVFFDRVVEDLIEMHNRAGAPLKTVHTGGDEVPHGVWEGSPACESLAGENLHDYFLDNINAILQKYDLALAGWEEIAFTESQNQGVATKSPNERYMNQGFQPHVWNTVWGWGMEDMAYRLANSGYRVVLSNATNLYFDFAYNKHPLEPGYYWASFSDTYNAFSFIPLDLYKNAQTDHNGNAIDRRAMYGEHERLTEGGKANILGIQGQLWSETATSEAAMQYMIAPKILGLAERAWAQQPTWAVTEDDAIREALLSLHWNRFANKIGRHELPRLDTVHGGIAYRIPPPGATVLGDSLYANTAFPGMTIRYTTNGEEPGVNDPVYTSPILMESPVRLRTFSSNGRASRTVTVNP